MTLYAFTIYCLYLRSPIIIMNLINSTQSPNLNFIKLIRCNQISVFMSIECSHYCTKPIFHCWHETSSVPLQPTTIVKLFLSFQRCILYKSLVVRTTVRLVFITIEMFDNCKQWNRFSREQCFFVYIVFDLPAVTWVACFDL